VLPMLHMTNWHLQNFLMYVVPTPHLHGKMAIR